jgi:hypothetical protein
MQQVNRQLATLYPESPLRYRVEATSISLMDARHNAPFVFTELSPVKTIEVLMAGLTVPHALIYGCQPIFLLDTNGMTLQFQDRVDLLEGLRRYCSSGQCFLVPDEELLHICVDADEKSAQRGDSGVRFIDV